MAENSLTELQEQKRALDAQIAAASLPGLTAMQSALNSDAATGMFDEVNAAIGMLGANSPATMSATNWLGTLSIVRRQIDRECEAAQALIDAAAIGNGLAGAAGE